MANVDTYDTLLEITGPADALQRFRARHLAGNRFTFDSIEPMPRELDFEFNNFVEDGHDALYGDWRKLAERWMFKQDAAQRGHPFPLESRAQVLDCIAALGAPGEARLALGQRFQSNLERFGHGHKGAWRREHWGTGDDADETVADMEADRTRVAFSTSGAPPRQLLRRLGESDPALEMRVEFLDERGRRTGAMHLRSGRVIKCPAPVADQCKATVWGFRRGAGLRWLEATLPCPDVVAMLEMNERGRAVLKGTNVALDFALRRLAAGEPVQELAARFPALRPAHLDVLARLHACAGHAQPGD